MKKFAVVLLALVALAAVGGCSSDDDPAGSLCSPADFAGLWQGTLIISSAGTHQGYPFAVELGSAGGDKLAGTWMAKRVAAGELKGAADGCTAAFDVLNADCPGWVMQGTMSFAKPGGSPEWSMTGTWCNGLKATSTAALTKVP
jgi:hypothetical protein